MPTLQNSIFNRKLLQKAIERHLDLPQIEHLQQKRAILKNWQHAIESMTIKKTGEVALHGDFLIDIFGQVLGYYRQIEHPTEWHLTHEQKTLLDATKSDGALGFFTTDTQDIRAVIELKSLRTDLDAKQHRKDDKRSPVEQAFSYAHKAGGKCQWVIVSNYQELRLYHASFSGKCEVFHLTELGNEVEFLRFYYVLASPHLFTKTGESPVEALYRQSLESEQAITGQFYAQYTQTRRELFEHLKQQNPDRSELTLLTHTQQLLDRFIFICFCEDTGDLLPEKTFRTLIHHAQDSIALTTHYGTQKIWTELKAFFGAMNSGLSSHRIPGFNGELFKPDPVFDTLHIEDAIFLKLAHLTEYDFQSELNVNILGHIFEQSLTDLEELRSEIRGEPRDRKHGKRKKEGIFYTPEYITRYIVEQAIGGWLEDRRRELAWESLPELTIEDEEWLSSTTKKKKPNPRIERNIAFWEAYLECIKRITVLDPACGSGAFLTQAFDYLLHEGERVNRELNHLRPGEQLGLFSRKTWDKAILRNNLFGVDLNPESVEITKLALWLKTAKKDDQLTTLNQNIKCGNSLIDDQNIEGEKAFLWKQEFPEIINNGGFDVIIGNPPYAGRSSSISEKEKIFIRSHYITSEGKYDLYQLFIEKCIYLVNPRGAYISLITPQTWLSLVQATKLRKEILLNVNLEKIIFLGTGVFEASVDTIIFLITSGKPTEQIEFYHSRAILESEDNHLAKVIHLSEIKPPEYIIPISSYEQSGDILTKIVSQAITLAELGDWKDGVKVIGDAQKFAFQYDQVNQSFFPIITGSDIDRYFSQWNGLYCCRDKQQILEHHASDIRLREEEIFQKNKILIRKTGNKIVATLDENKLYYEQSLFSYSLNTEQYHLKYILALLNSKLSNYILKNNPFSKKETFPQIRLHWLKEFPIKKSDREGQNILIEKTNTMLSLNKRLHESRDKFLHFLELSYHLKKLTNKIKVFYTLAFNDFIMELKKQKVSLSKKDEFDLMGLFEEQKKHIGNIKKTLDATDKEIDSIVYQLYNLTEEEIQCIESSI